LFYYMFGKFNRATGYAVFLKTGYNYRLIDGKAPYNFRDTAMQMPSGQKRSIGYESEKYIKAKMSEHRKLVPMKINISKK